MLQLLYVDQAFKYKNILKVHKNEKENSEYDPFTQ